MLKDKGLTKRALCEGAGISYNTLASLFKRRSSRIEIDTLRKIADFLGTTIEYLTTGKEELGAISDQEAALVLAYRNNPAMREAVDKLLGIN